MHQAGNDAGQSIAVNHFQRNTGMQWSHNLGMDVKQIANHRLKGFVEIEQVLEFFFIKRAKIVGIIFEKRA